MTFELRVRKEPVILIATAVIVTYDVATQQYRRAVAQLLVLVAIEIILQLMRPADED